MASVAKRTWIHKGQEKTAWVVRYKDAGGAHRSRQFDRKKDADPYRLKVETEIEKGVHVAAGASVKLEVLADEYLKSLELRHREGRRMGTFCLKLQRGTMRNHILPALGNRLASELTWGELEAWCRALLVTSKLAPKSARHVMNHLSLALDFGVKRGLLSVNHMPSVMKEFKGVTPTRIRTFKRDNMLAILETLERKGYKTMDRSHAWLRCMVYLAAICGLRRGEILGLTWSSLDFEARVIRVRHNLTEYGEHKGPKTAAGVRDVPMPEIIVQALQAWETFAVPHAAALVFRTRTGAACLTHGSTAHGTSCWSAPGSKRRARRTSSTSTLFGISRPV